MTVQPFRAEWRRVGLADRRLERQIDQHPSPVVHHGEARSPRRSGAMATYVDQLGQPGDLLRARKTVPRPPRTSTTNGTSLAVGLPDIRGAPRCRLARYRFSVQIAHRQQSPVSGGSTCRPALPATGDSRRDGRLPGFDYGSGCLSRQAVGQMRVGADQVGAAGIAL